MATVYLPVEPIEGMDSAERAEALDAEVWRLRRPLSLQSPQDITKYYYPRITHPDTGQVAIVGDTTEEVYINPAVDLTDMLALLPEVPQEEKDGLVMFVDANKGGSIPFGQLIPSTSTQLTQEEAEALGLVSRQTRVRPIRSDQWPAVAVRRKSMGTVLMLTIPASWGDLRTKSEMNHPLAGDMVSTPPSAVG